MSDRPRVSLTMIVRDEACNLPACLSPVRRLFDELVVVDTGSLDDTREVAAALGARVFDVPWADSFAAARNAALDRATGDWAVRLDADERLDPSEIERLRAALDALPAEPVGWTVRCRHETGGRSVEMDEVRLFPIRPDIRWTYRVHEQIAPSMRAAGGAICSSGVTVRHEGYTDPNTTRRKLERNRQLLELDRADRPADPFVLFYLGWTRLDLGDAVGATESLTEACRTALSGFDLLPRCHALLGRAYAQLGDAARVVDACRAGRTAYPRDAELACLEAEGRLATGDATGAEALFRALLGGGWDEDPRAFAEGVRGHRARHGLASALPPDRAAEKEYLWRAVVAERRDYGPAWLGFGDFLAGMGRWADLRAVARAACEALPGRPEGVLLRGRWLAGTGDYRGARRELGRYCGQHPGAVTPRLALLRVILLEGRDQGAADRVLREVTAAAPGHPEVAQLRDLLARWGRR